MFTDRVGKVREVLREKNLDGLLVSDFYNVYYLTGFKPFSSESREAFVLVTDKNIYLFTDGRYINKNSKFKVQTLRIGGQSSKLVLKIIDYKNSLVVHLQKIIESEGIEKMGFEADDLKFSEYELLKEKLPLKEFVSTEKIILRLRSVKSDEEIKNIAKACKITDQCLREISKMIKIGMTEKELLFLIENWIRQKGYGLAFDPFIIASGKNSAIPHYNTRDGNGKIEMGSFVLIDFGVNYNNYLSDVTRIFFIGKQTDEVIKTYNALVKVQQATIDNLEKVVDLKSADEFCRKEFEKNGLPNYPHSTGHGVGLEIHESPKISPNTVDKIANGQIVTIEPGVYFEGKWGMRIEDTVCIKNGQTKSLTKFPREFAIL